MDISNQTLTKSIETLSEHYVERFRQLRDNEQYQDADAIGQEYICNGEVEDDNYLWIYAPYKFEGYDEEEAN